MMKSIISRRLARSQEQPRPLETSIFAEQQQQAKTGTITAPSGADPIIKSLGDSQPVQDTLAGIARQALGAAALTKKVVINLADRTVTVVPSATDVHTPLEAAAGVGRISQLTKDDPTKATSPWTDADDDPNIAPVIEEAKPSMSVESLVNKIEDEYATPGLAASSAIVVIDQANSKVDVYHGAVEDVAAFDAAATFAEDAHFVQTLVAAGGAQFGE